MSHSLKDLQYTCWNLSTKSTPQTVWLQLLKQSKILHFCKSYILCYIMKQNQISIYIILYNLAKSFKDWYINSNFMYHIVNDAQSQCYLLDVVYIAVLIVIISIGMVRCKMLIKDVLKLFFTCGLHSCIDNGFVYHNPLAIKMTS